jgi:hypothetical protein
VYLEEDAVRGGSVFKALAYGAKGVFLHRPLSWAARMAAADKEKEEAVGEGGEGAGALPSASSSSPSSPSPSPSSPFSLVLSLLAEELRTTMQLCGVTGVGGITQEYVCAKPTSAVSVARAFGGVVAAAAAAEEKGKDVAPAKADGAAEQEREKGEGEETAARRRRWVLAALVAGAASAALWLSGKRGALK